jgi:hypothetical protein
MNEIVGTVLGFGIGAFIAVILIIHGYVDRLFDWLLDGRNALVAIILLVGFLVVMMLYG